MNHNVPEIEITRSENHHLSEVKVIMPIWTRKGDDAKLYASLPLLGIETYGDTEEDLDIAINEAVKCFCIASEQHGLGLESELQFIGWKPAGQSKDHALLTIDMDMPLFEGIINTGEPTAMTVEVSDNEIAYA